MWIKKQSDKFKIPNYSKEYFRKPTILKLLGNVKGKKLLEVGCGSGYWTRLFAKKGAICSGIELNKNQLRIAVEEEKYKNLGIKYYLGNASNISMIESNSQDVVFIEFLLLEIKMKSLLKKTFAECFRVLRKNGLLFISDMHPFDPFFDKRYKLPDRFNYYSSGDQFVAMATQTDGTKIRFTDHHWTFEDYFNTLTSSGFIVFELREPRPSKSLIKRMPYFAYREFLPKTLMIKAKKT